MNPLPQVDINVRDDGTITVEIDTDWGRRGGTLTPDRAAELAGQLGGAAEYARSMEETNNGRQTERS